ncbi:penicillin-binding protein 1C [Pendulispora rubella]|uniref:peptidoglycan glycosyltransferase n=1 Tax=Pendulispora rubella TaxID=2741070 RepID=A0ABZ2LHM2_9BACT
MSRWKRFAWLLVIPVAPIWLVAIVVAFTRQPAELRDRAGSYSQSVRYVDREGGLLREVRADDASRARWIPLEEMGTYARMSMLAAEDRRFYVHAGVDPVAVLRAFASDVWQRRIVSGASTLTMQLARLVRPHPRNLWGKVTEAAFAVRIERALPKDRILEEYMNRAPFGPNLRGLDAASRYYFDKPPRALSLAEAATLAAIPRGPSLYAPTRDEVRVLRRRNRILDRMLAAGVISEEQHRRASDEPLVVRKAKGTFGAPHLVQALMSGRFEGPPPSDGSPVVTTLDRDLQSEAETETLRAVGSLQKKHVTAASVLVLDNATGEVLAYVGSHGFGDAEHGGQNDGVLARRQPGSTLKPFVYGLGMEERELTSVSLLPDLEMHIELPDGVYAPKNYDERFHGPVRLREALANSYNVPAVWVGQQVGAGRLLERLHALGFHSLDQASDYYGPALALGDGEVTLLELTNAYAAIARGGVVKPVRFVRGAPSAASEGTRVMPVEMAAVLTDILRDKGARIASFGERSVLDLPFDVAVKTGTSKGFRDNWTVGFTREVTVGVWAGNFDGSAMSGISGITGAGPLFRSVMDAAMRGRPKGSLAPDPDAVSLRAVDVCPLSGGAPTSACPHAIRDYVPRDRSLDPCTMHESVSGRVVERYPAAFTAWAHAAGREGARGEGKLHLAYPHDGARFAIDPERPRGLQSISVRIEAPRGVEQAALRIDGQLVARTGSPFVVRWPLEQGTHTFVAEANGTSSPPVRVEVD